MAKPDLEAAIAKTTSVFAERNPMAGNKLPVSEFLKGKELTLRYDDWLALEYRFDDVQKLRWRRAGESAWHEERYEWWESAHGVLMLRHVGPRMERPRLVREDPRRALFRVLARRGLQRHARDDPGQPADDARLWRRLSRRTAGFELERGRRARAPRGPVQRDEVFQNLSL